MGRFGTPQVGFFADERDNDIPELNQCPSCGAFFEGDVCPICQTVCPENMKAGNRAAPPKKKKKEKPVGYRVKPVFYLRTWFIILMLFTFRLIGIVLVWLSDWKEWVKVTVTVLALAGGVLLTYLVFPLLSLLSPREPTVNFSISEEAYRAKCAEVGCEELLRDPQAHRGEYLKITATVETVKKRYSGGPDLLLLTDADGNRYVVTDYRKDGKSLLTGDTVTVFGEFTGADISDLIGDHVVYPTVNAAYIDLIRETASLPLRPLPAL